MILSHQYFRLQDKTVIEKLQIKGSLRQSPVFQNEACFLYFKEGRSTLITPTEQVYIETKESVLLKCGTYFAEIINNANLDISEVYVIHLFPEVLKEIYKNEIPEFIKVAERPYFAKKIPEKNLITQFIQSIEFYFENQQVVSAELLHLKLKELILLLLETDEKETIKGLFDHLFSPRKVTLATLVQTHLFTNCSLQEMAALAGMSMSTFKREFKLHFQLPPAQYIREKRMEKAAELLVVSHFSIAEISFQLGYEDSSYFARIFHQFYQMSPSYYRSLHQIENRP
ncbi:helix-turn-helix transcriptional regulator [Flavobacterium sp. J27]|uniref:helix-turn-helix transcriptional regulator n=1 Tax=Flavobacterium sp. J27 TaxID=2060419 RepID=UPI001030B3AA|nr:helix-turn-helix transcriptional regulator [Flavobacterium sp. J27]